MFDATQLDILESIGVKLENDKDYSDDELMKFHDIITDKYLYEFNADGVPTKKAFLFEKIIDTFYDKLEI